MPKVSPFPEPKMRFHGARWRIYWKWQKRQYSVATEYFDPKKAFAVTADLRRIAAALTMDPPTFPEQYAATPAAAAYIRDRYGEPKPAAAVEIPDDATILDMYDTQMSSECNKEWARNSRVRLAALSKMAGGILNVTPALANQFLVEIKATRTAATRNRALHIGKRFFNWAKTLLYYVRGDNPFAGIKLLKEPKVHTIVYCTRSERARLINMARKNGFPDWIGVAVAFYAGMRMDEICRLRWEDISWDTGRISVLVTKNQKSRPVDMNSKLRAMLSLTPTDKRVGYVVPSVPGAPSRRDRAQTLVRQLRKIAAREKQPIPLERIGWNAWRHTFATLLVQEGVSLETVCSLMGNTPEVCRRHYAQFMPRDKRLAAIDKL